MMSMVMRFPFPFHIQMECVCLFCDSHRFQNNFFLRWHQSTSAAHLDDIFIFTACFSIVDFPGLEKKRNWKNLWGATSFLVLIKIKRRWWRRRHAWHNTQHTHEGKEAGYPEKAVGYSTIIIIIRTRHWRSARNGPKMFGNWWKLFWQWHTFLLDL